MHMFNKAKNSYMNNQNNYILDFFHIRSDKIKEIIGFGGPRYEKSC